MDEIIVTTTSSVEGYDIEEYLGIRAGQAVMGANIVKDLFAGIRDIIGGRTKAYEETISKGREEAIKDLKKAAKDLGANAVVGIQIDYEEMREGALWMTVTGTAVKLKPKKRNS
ncbi:MAG: YbjQ family protein [Candidatus Korarchaeota archaeon]|nr:YbjQ family protein [Candidatus Korarchaeota archaeon]NIU85370.1 heavy metal-binding domain-containing protein [Candidatus Thorarchaeota archaeon]NIW15468.1 heavy metal-binding domain-containing protein [Candidatus Thorarchaeota archaeon]NIW53412.1 heavy metal-binding domain-containing protein [Candidatus Korarchaeota archaeon]